MATVCCYHRVTYLFRLVHLRDLRTCLVLVWIVAVCFCVAFLALVSRESRVPNYGERTTTDHLATEFDIVVDDYGSAVATTNAMETDDGDGVEVLDVDTASWLENEASLTDVVEKKYPHLPFRFWTRRKMQRLRVNSTCACLRPVFSVHHNNLFWQTMRTRDGTSIYIYGAYFDDRPLVGDNPVVRLLTMIDSTRPPPVLCQFWYDNANRPAFSPLATHTYVWRKNWLAYTGDSLQPYLVTCALPSRSRWIPIKFDVPHAVSLVESECQNATNVIRVSNIRPSAADDQHSGGIAVCVKGVSMHRDSSVQLVEWLELLKLLGCRRVFIYELYVHANISKVLRHYESEGFLDVRPLTLPGTLLNIPELYDLYYKLMVNTKRQNEVVPYNDCLYRNMYTFDYVALLDLDEMIVPTGDLDNWPDVIEVLRQQTGGRKSALCARNIYFFNETSGAEALEENIPSYLPMLNTVYRSVNFTKRNQYVKCFHDTKRVLALHNHYPLVCLDKKPCQFVTADEGIVRLHHYRKDCVRELRASCKRDFIRTQVRDTTIWTYKEELVNNTKHTLRKLGFLKKSPNDKHRLN